MTEYIAGVPIPDTRLVADMTELAKADAPPLLFHHSRRVYLFGMLQGRRRGLPVDPELLYVGAMCHDLGLTEKYRSKDQRFEVDGADQARAFLLGHGIGEREARRIWTEIALLTAGVETDVLGIGYHDLDPADISAVVAAHPRPDFKRQILAAFTNG